MCLKVLFGADETSLFSSGADGFVREWNAHMSGKELWSHQASSFETHVSIAGTVSEKACVTLRRTQVSLGL